MSLRILDKLVSVIAYRLKPWNLQVNEGKTERITIQPGTRDQTRLKKFGSQIDRDLDVTYRIERANICFYALLKLWAGSLTAAPVNKRVHIYNVSVKTTLLYNIKAAVLTTVLLCWLVKRPTSESHNIIIILLIIMSQDIRCNQPTYGDHGEKTRLSWDLSAWSNILTIVIGRLPLTFGSSPRCLKYCSIHSRARRSLSCRSAFPRKSNLLTMISFRRLVAPVTRHQVQPAYVRISW